MVTVFERIALLMTGLAMMATSVYLVTRVRFPHVGITFGRIALVCVVIAIPFASNAVLAAVRS